MTKITISLNAQVEGGPQMGSSLVFDVNAYDYIDEVVKADGTELIVNLQPSENKNIEFLLIQASGDFEPSAVTYGVNNSEKIVLKGPHLYLGAGGVSLLGAEVKTLKFKNKKVDPPDEKKNAKLKILVGRDPAPPA